MSTTDDEVSGYDREPGDLVGMAKDHEAADVVFAEWTGHNINHVIWAIPDPNEWDALLTKEREHQVEIGYTLEHDAEHGPVVLLLAAEEYIRRGQVVQGAAIMRAARELIQGPDARRFGELPEAPAYRTDGDDFPNPRGSGQ